MLEPCVKPRLYDVNWCDSQLNHGPDRDVSKAGGVMESGTRQGTDARNKVGSVWPVESWGVTCGICMGLFRDWRYWCKLAERPAQPPTIMVLSNRHLPDSTVCTAEWSVVVPFLCSACCIELIVVSRGDE